MPRISKTGARPHPLWPALLAAAVLTSTGRARAEDGAISGTVVDDEGRPAAGAVVWLVDSPVFIGPAIVLGRGETDAEGRFRLDLLEDIPAGEDRMHGFRMIWAHRPGSRVAGRVLRAFRPLGSRVRPAADHDGPIRLVLRPPASAQVRVVGPDGAPAAWTRAAVIRLHEFPGNLPEELIDRLAVEPDVDGRATLSAAAPLAISHVVVDSLDYGRQTMAFLRGLHGEKTIALRECQRVEGRVLADDPAAARGLKVHVHTIPPGRNPGVSTYGSAFVETDAEGKFAVPVIAAGDARVSVWTRPSSPYLAPLEPKAEARPGKLAVIEVALKKTVRVNGAIRDEAGGPVPGARVGFQGRGGLTPPVMTDPRGRFSALAIPGQAFVSITECPGGFVRFPDFNLVTIPEEDGQELPPIELQRGAAVRGVVLEGGRPAAGAAVEARWRRPWRRPNGEVGVSSFSTVETARSGEDGSFVVANFPAGIEVKLSASLGDARTAVVATATAGAGAKVTLDLDPDGTVSLTGRVVDEAARPIAGARVLVAAAPTGEDWPEQPYFLLFDEVDQIVTDADGRFRTPRQIRRGASYVAQAWAPEKAAANSEWLALGPGVAPTFPDVVLKPPPIEGPLTMNPAPARNGP